MIRTMELVLVRLIEIRVLAVTAECNVDDMIDNDDIACDVVDGNGSESNGRMALTLIVVVVVTSCGTDQS